MQPILTVNLSTGAIGEYIIPLDWQKEYLGGASLAARVLYEHFTPDLEPLSPRAPLLFLNGPLTGTSGPAVGRFVVVARSPATRLWGESNCGGFWGVEVRKAGYDGILVSGHADHPVYLWVRDGQVEIHDASHLWGLDTYQTQEAVTAELRSGRVRVAVIGPAGEEMIPFATILTDHGRMAGRTGMGAVMGSKNMKAIAVQGNGKVPVVDPEAFSPLRSQSNHLLKSDSQTQVVHELGTASVADYLDYLGEMPKRYFQSDSFEGAVKISGASMAETILTGTSACHACVIACGRVVKLEDGQKRKGPEYETLVGFGPNLWLDDPVFATRMGELCDRYGMDTISLSNTIGLTFRLYEMGVITESDTGGLALRWGDAGVVERLVHQTGRREGFGAYLAEGARALAGRFGAEDEAVQVNGLEAPYHDPRGASGMALVYATSPRGACHNQSDYFMVEIGQAEASLGLEYISRHAGEEKARNVRQHQDWRTLFNSLVMCYFSNIPPEMVVSLINAACGLDWDIDQALLAGERGWNLKRLINIRLGLRRENDRLPKAMLAPFPPGGGSEGYVPPVQEMLQAYYNARGWDTESGFPTQSRLEALGLDWVLKDLKHLTAMKH